MQKIAVFLPNWIGDVVMATPAIRKLREHYPQAKMVAISRPYVAATIEANPWFNETWLYDKKAKSAPSGWSIMARLRREKFDLAILLPNSFRVAAFAWLGGVKRIIGFSRYGRGILLTDRFKPLRDKQGKIQPTPIIDDYNQLLQPLGIDNVDHTMQLFTTADDEIQADGIWAKNELLNATEIIAINPGAAFGAAKHWPIDSFAKLIRRFHENRGSSCLVLCGPNERDMADQIVQKADCNQVCSLAKEKLSLGLTKAIIRRSNLLVTTDSGPRHFAAAFNRPVVSLFGPTFIEWTETYFEKAINLQKQVPCGPCQLRVCPYDHACMKNLSVDEVYAAATDLLQRYPADTEGFRHAG